MLLQNNNKQLVKAISLRLVIVLLTWSQFTPVGTLPTSSPTHQGSTRTATTSSGSATTGRPCSSSATASSCLPSASTGVSDNRPTTNVFVTNGSTVDLSCSLATASPATIVWLQGDDGFKVLFYGSNRATDDKRMSVRILVEEGAIKSTLRIEPVSYEDQGTFICRVPRRDHIYTEVIQLFVKVPAALPSPKAPSSLQTQAKPLKGNDTELTATS